MPPGSGLSGPKTHPLICTLFNGFAYVKDFGLENVAAAFTPTRWRGQPAPTRRGRRYSAPSPVCRLTDQDSRATTPGSLGPQGGRGSRACGREKTLPWN